MGEKSKATLKPDGGGWSKFIYQQTVIVPKGGEAKRQQRGRCQIKEISITKEDYRNKSWLLFIQNKQESKVTVNFIQGYK